MMSTTDPLEGWPQDVRDRLTENRAHTQRVARLMAEPQQILDNFDDFVEVSNNLTPTAISRAHVRYGIDESRHQWMAGKDDVFEGIDNDPEFAEEFYRAALEFETRWRTSGVNPDKALRLEENQKFAQMLYTAFRERMYPLVLDGRFGLEEIFA